MSQPQHLQHIEWMQRAIDTAQQALPVDVPVGALIIGPDGLVIGKAHNEREQHHTPSAHAEILAIDRAAKALHQWRLKGCWLYVTLEPCPMCASLILQSKIKGVVYGASDTLQGALGSVLNLPATVPGGHQLEIIAGILETECQQLLTRFFSQHRRPKHPGLL